MTQGFLIFFALSRKKTHENEHVFPISDAIMTSGGLDYPHPISGPGGHPHPGTFPRNSKKNQCESSPTFSMSTLSISAASSLSPTSSVRSRSPTSSSSPDFAGKKAESGKKLPVLSKIASDHEADAKGATGANPDDLKELSLVASG